MCSPRVGHIFPWWWFQLFLGSLWMYTLATFKHLEPPSSLHCRYRAGIEFIASMWWSREGSKHWWPCSNFAYLCCACDLSTSSNWLGVKTSLPIDSGVVARLLHMCIHLHAFCRYARTCISFVFRMHVHMHANVHIVIYPYIFAAPVYVIEWGIMWCIVACNSIRCITRQYNQYNVMKCSVTTVMSCNVMSVSIYVWAGMVWHGMVWSWCGIVWRCMPHVVWKVCMVPRICSACLLFVWYGWYVRCSGNLQYICDTHGMVCQSRVFIYVCN